MVVLAVGAWVYLLMNGTPRGADDFFTDLGFSDPAPERPAVILDTPDVTVDTNSQRLNQLTTRPVAGYTAVNTASSSAVVYAEKGTGHIYSIDLNSGTETRLSGTTLSRVVEAVFDRAGTNVVLVTEEGYQQQAYLLELTASSTELVELPEQTSDHAFENGSLFYTRIENGSTVGYLFNLSTASANQIFVTPLIDISVIRQNNTTYLFNKPAQRLRGALYRLNAEGDYELLSGPAYGLTATSDLPGDWLISRIDTESQTYRTYHVNVNSGKETELALVTIPEKCTQTSNSVTWCTLPFLPEASPTYLNDWYQGTYASNDNIWQINSNNGEAVLSLVIEETAGFEIDATNVSASAEKLFFTNRHNDTLWSYDIQ